MPTRLARLLAAAALLAPTMLAAQATPVASAARGTFVMLHGADTISVERFARVPRAGGIGDSVTADLRLTGGVHIRETVIDSGGLVPRLRLEQWRPGAGPDAAPGVRLDMQIGADSAVVDMAGTRQALGVRAGTLPWINPTISLVDQLVHRARVLGGAHVEIPSINLQGAAQFVSTVETLGRDSVLVRFPDSEMRASVDAAGRVTGLRIVAQNVVVVRTGPLPEPGASSAAPSSRPGYAPPAGAPYAAEEVTLRAADGATLAGTFTRPTATKGRVPAVVLLTGSGPEDRDEAMSVVPGYRPFRQIADTLGRRGIAVLRLDDRGVGGSTGVTPDVTMQTFAADVRAALAWLRSRPDVDPARLAILGHSEGTETAGLVAADDRALRALVLLGAPASTGRATSDRQVRAALLRMMPDSSPAARERVFVRNAVGVDSMLAHSAFGRSWFALDPLVAAARVRQPVLILQGATDTQVPPDESTKLAAALRAGGNRDVTVRLFPATNHLFLADSVGEAGPGASRYASLPSKQVRPEVLGAIADWLAGKLK